MGSCFRLALLLATAALAGCGGSGPSGEASKSGSAILADARQAALAADSVRIVGTVRNAGQVISLDLSVAAQGRGGGTMTLNGSKVDVTRVGHTMYMRAGAEFYRRFGARTAAGRLLDGKWVKVPTTTQNFAQLVLLTDLYGFLTQALHTSGKVTKGAVKTVVGQNAIELRSAHGGSLYVATSGKPYPLEFTSPVAPMGTLMLSEWNSAKTPTAPPHALDLGALGK
jgi:ABC-type glycerol-3-phosphate transport system substrate-binding protein